MYLEQESDIIKKEIIIKKVMTGKEVHNYIKNVSKKLGRNIALKFYALNSRENRNIFFIEAIEHNNKQGLCSINKSIYS